MSPKFSASLRYFAGTPTSHPTKFSASLRYFAGTPTSHPTKFRRRAVTAAVAAGCALALGITGAVSSAADTGDQKRAVDQQIQDIQGALDETSADLANAYNALQATQSQLPAAQAALTQAEDAEHTANQHNDEVAAQLAVAQANEQRAVETQTANKAKLDQTQSVLDNFAADLFQGGGGGSQMSVALGATSADDFATRVVLADQVTSLTDNALKELQNARAEATAQESYLKAVEAEVTQLKHEAEDALAKAQAARTAAATAKTNLDNLLAQQSAYAAQVESKKAAELQRLADAEAEQASSRPPSRPRRAPQPPPRRLGRPPLARPDAATPLSPAAPDSSATPPTGRSPRRSGCGTTRSCTSGSSTPAPTSAFRAAPRSSPPPTAPSSVPDGAAATATASSSTTAS